MGDREGAEGEPVVGTFLGEDAGPLGVGPGKLEGALDGLGAGVAEEAGVTWGEFFGEGLGEETGEDGAVHLDHVGEIEFQNVADGFLEGGMITADIEDAVAAEEVEVVLAVEVVEVGAFTAGVDLVKADGALDLHERAVHVLVVQIVVLAQPGEDRVFEVEFGHGLNI